MIHKSNSTYKVIGLMSGTSLDGLDISYCQLTVHNKKWNIDKTISTTIDYPLELRERLANAIELNQSDLDILDKEYGQFLGNQTAVFIEQNQLNGQVDLIASHGHTVFHQPEKGITVQIGNAQTIVDVVNLPLVNNFRIKDVELGGQGAPLVPVGDELLFGNYQACLNLGGIANISFRHNNERIAFDISPANLPLNKLMRTHFQNDYDHNGNTAATGKVNTRLLAELNGLAFYQMKSPKSLGVEWLNHFFYPVLEPYRQIGVESILATIVAHETDQIAAVLNKNKITDVLVTGGGAYNSFFMEELKGKTRAELKVPSSEIISFKEAIIFGLLGVLNIRDEINTYRSVTGAKADSIGGVRTFPSNF